MRLKKLLLLINIIVTGLILWLGYGVASTWIHNSRNDEDSAGPSEKQGEPQPPLVKKPVTAENYRIIINRDIFDAKSKAKADPVKEKKDAPISKRDLELKGTVVGENGHSYAIILDRKKRTQSLYYIDDDISGARIVKILPDMVVLDTGKDEEILPLILEDGKGPPGPGPGPPPRPDRPEKRRPPVKVKR